MNNKLGACVQTVCLTVVSVSDWNLQCSKKKVRNKLFGVWCSVCFFNFLQQKHEPLSALTTTRTAVAATRHTAKWYRTRSPGPHVSWNNGTCTHVCRSEKMQNTLQRNLWLFPRWLTGLIILWPHEAGPVRPDKYTAGRKSRDEHCVSKSGCISHLNTSGGVLSPRGSRADYTQNINTLDRTRASRRSPSVLWKLLCGVLIRHVELLTERAPETKAGLVTG